MAIVGRTIINGNSIIVTAIPPADENFDYLEMCGNFTVDELQILNKVLTIEELKDQTGEQVFGTFHILLAHFEDNLKGGNFDSGGLTITSWNILRKKEGEASYTLIANVSATAPSEYLDIRAASGQDYRYAVQAVASGTAGDLVESEVVSMSFHGWSLQSLDYDGLGNGTIYVFDTEISSDSLKVNMDRTRVETHFKYPKTYYGELEYINGGLKTMPISCNEEQIVEPNSAILGAIKSFINDKNEKILKNGSGEVYRVSTHEFSWKYRDILTNHNDANPNSQPFDINFKFDEVGAV